MGGYAAPLHPSIAGVASDSPLLCATRARPKPPSTNASTLVRPSWRRDSLANPKASSGPWPERWAGGARPIMVEGSPKQSLRCFLPVRWDYMYCNTVEALLTSNDLFSPGPVHPSYHHDVRRPPAPPGPVDSASTANVWVQLQPTHPHRVDVFIKTTNQPKKEKVLKTWWSSPVVFSEALPISQCVQA